MQYLLLFLCLALVFLCVWKIRREPRERRVNYSKIRKQPRPLHNSSNHNSNHTNPHKIILFLHLHKAAGSTVCHIAGKNGMRVNKRDNCNVQPDQRCCGGETVAAQARFYHDTTYTFVANEGYLYADLDTAHYTYMTVLRRSIDRYYSHYHFLGHFYTPAAYGTWEEWLTGQPDNWNVRHICGTRCQHIPKFSLSIEDFLFTVERLSQFTYVLFEESLTEDLQGIASRLQWHDTAIPRDNTQQYDNNDHDHTTQLDVRRNTSWYQNMTYLDDMLYAYAHNRSLTTVCVPCIEEEIKQYNETGPRYNNSCGTFCSKYR